MGKLLLQYKRTLSALIDKGSQINGEGLIEYILNQSSLGCTILRRIGDDFFHDTYKVKGGDFLIRDLLFIESHKLN